MGVINFLVPFLSNPTSNNDILRKLSVCAFWETYFITLFLRTTQEFNELCKEFESWAPIKSLPEIFDTVEKINLSGFILGFVVAGLSAVLPVHNIISDIFGIRRSFDIEHILIPLSERVGSTVDREKIERNRQKIMRAVFYKYASSRAEKPLVDKHDIEQALGGWFWFWASIEGILYLIAGAIAAWWLGAKLILLVFSMAIVGLCIFASLRKRRLPGLALIEIDTIAVDPSARLYVQNYFDAL